MRHLLLILALALLSCGPPSGYERVDDLVEDTCGRYGAVCIPYDLAVEYGYVDPSFRWGVFNGATLRLVGLNIRAGVVIYDEDRCAADLDLCGFVLLHEIGHLREGSNQTAADCWAAERATDEQNAAAIEELCIRPSTRCDALVECAQ